MGSSLEAEVNLYFVENGQITNFLQSFRSPVIDPNNRDNIKVTENELRFLFITSSAEIKHVDKDEIKDKLSISVEINSENNQMHNEKTEIWYDVKPSTNKKCARCWHRRPDVGSDHKHPDICGRCVKNLPETKGEGEERYRV